MSFTYLAPCYSIHGTQSSVGSTSNLFKLFNHSCVIQRCGQWSMPLLHSLLYCVMFIWSMELVASGSVVVYFLFLIHQHEVWVPEHSRVTFWVYIVQTEMRQILTPSKEKDTRCFLELRCREQTPNIYSRNSKANLKMSASQSKLNINSRHQKHIIALWKLRSLYLINKLHICVSEQLYCCYLTAPHQCWSVPS